MKEFVSKIVIVFGILLGVCDGGKYAPGDCTTVIADVTFKNGSQWEAADNSCRICTCLNGETQCENKKCLPDEDLPCKRPRRRGVECCKSCPVRDRKKGSKRKRRMRKICLRDSVTRHRRRHERRKSGSRRGERRKEHNVDRSKRSVGTKSEFPPLREQYPVSSFNGVPSFYDDMCVPVRSDYLIYRHIENKEMFMAFENLKSETVDVWKWKLKRKACLGIQAKLERCRKGSGDIRLENTTFTKTSYPADVFRLQVDKVMLFASTTKKQVVLFQHSLQQSMNKCSPKGSCRVKMITRKFYYKRMRLYDVFYDCDKCKEKT